MKDFQRHTERELGMKLSSKQPIPWALQANCIGDYEYLKTQLSQDTLMSNVGVDYQQGIPVEWSPKTPNVLKYCAKDYSQNCTDTNNFNYQKFGSRESGINWDYMSNILSKTSGAAEVSNYLYAPVLWGHSTIDDLRWLGMPQRTTLLDSGEESGSLWSPSASHYRCEESGITHPVYQDTMGNRVLQCDEACHGLYSQSPLPSTCLTSGIRQLYDQRYVFPSQKEGIRNNDSIFQDVKKQKDWMPLSTSENQFDSLRKPSQIKCLEGDDFSSDNSSTKRKFRLLVDCDTEARMRWAELYHQCLNLSDIITLKYRSLGIAVEVKSYQQPWPDKINTKAFNIMFENSSDVAKAFRLIDNGQLPFSLREARPSPSYHVKYQVLHPVSVFKGKCFRQKQIHELQVGDIVIANQLKGNKIRIIKWSPVGSKMQFDLPGWVLIKTKDTVLLSRMDRYKEKRVVGKTESSTQVTTGLQKQRSKEGKPQILESNPLRSAANCSPFKVLAEVEVRKGRKESAIVGRLKPGRIVWASQHKGSMLRITKMDTCGNIVMGANLKPKTWGWVCIQRRVDKKPRLVRMAISLVTKTRSGNVTEVSYPSKGRERSKTPSNDFKYCSESPHSDLVSIMQNGKENMVGISSSANRFSNMNYSGSESYMSESSLSTRPELLYNEPVLLF